jgi:uncharacterized repeat protein (TIGR04076 family)
MGTPSPAPDGYKIVATIKAVKGTCKAGHKVGDTFEISCRNTAGLCGFFYHDIFPTLHMLQFGGAYASGSDRKELECIDRKNAVTIELKRIM